MRIAAVAVVMLAWQTTRADTSVVKPAAAEPGWCVARYLKEAGRKPPRPAPVSDARPASFTLGATRVSFELAPPLVAALIGGDLVQVVSGAPSTSDAFTGWEPTLQLRWQTRAELEARIKSVISDFMGTTRAQIETRPTTVQGKPVEEVCAIVRRTPGHATTSDGRHHAMPDIVELVHGYLFSIGGRTLGAVYRVTPQAIEQLALWERVLDSLRFG